MTSSLRTIQQPASLPDLVRRAATSLAGAESAAEILDAREMARFARDDLKRQAAILKAKSAHGDVIAAVRRSQADAIEIESLADKRLADEYDAAQERGEVATGRDGPGAGVSGGNAKATVAEIGLSRKEIHEARQIRDAEKVEPGVVRRILDEKLAAGEEPTKAALRAGIAAVNGKKSHGAETLSVATEAAPEPEFDPLAVRAFVAPAPDYNGLPADQRIAELIDHVSSLEADIREYVAELKTYREMKVLFEQGGFDAVVAAKDELIRGMDTRIYSESADKAEWMRKAKFWEKQAKELGWRDNRQDAAASEVPAEYDEAFYAAISGAEG